MSDNNQEIINRAKISHHLCGAREIAAIFGVSRKTVAVWQKRGAPILYVGKKYQASYPELWNWLKGNIVGF